VRASNAKDHFLPPLLRVLEPAGCIVTIDAIGCQTEIADGIVQQHADYLLAVKENHGQLYQDIQDLFAGCRKVGFRDVPHDYAKTVNKDHTRYFISSLENNAKLALRAVRGHWGIENGLHWVLDIAFREDESRVRKDHGPENFAVLRHIALNLLKQDQTAKTGIKTKRLRLRMMRRTRL
jgi:predicted transposase YbfD/YdcC